MSKMTEQKKHTYFSSNFPKDALERMAANADQKNKVGQEFVSEIYPLKASNHVISYIINKFWLI